MVVRDYRVIDILHRGGGAAEKSSRYMLRPVLQCVGIASVDASCLTDDISR